MRKSDSRLISILLAFVMVVTLIPAQAFATSSEELPTVTADEEFTAVIDTYGGAACFRFTPEEDGLYTFQSYAEQDTYGLICDANGNTITSDSYSGGGLNFAVTIPMTKGVTYILKAKYNGGTTGSYPVKIYKTDTVEITEDTERTQEASSTHFYTFTAAEDGAYALYASTNAYIYVYHDSYWDSDSSLYEDWNTEDLFFDAAAGETVYLKVAIVNGNSGTLGVTKALPIESITCEDSEIRRYYIPSASECYDVYATITPVHADARNISWSFEDSSLAEIWVSEPNRCSFMCQGVGETYLIASDGDMELVRFPVIFENCPELTLNEPVTTTFFETDYFNFTPDVSATYSFSITQTDAQVTLSSANGMGGYGWNNADGDGYALSIALEAGETYCLKLSGSHLDETTCTLVVTSSSGVSSITADQTQIHGTYCKAYCPSCFLHLTYDPSDADLTDLEMTVLDPSVAEIRRLNAQTVMVTAVGVGSTELVVTAGTAELRIPITYEAPTPLLLDTPVTVYSESSNDEAFFQYTPEQSGSYTFYISDSDNFARFRLFDAEGNLVGDAYDYPYSTENKNAICVEIEAGETYELVAHSGVEWDGATFNISVSADLTISSISSETTALHFWNIPENFNFSRVNITIAPENAAATTVQWEILDPSVAVLDGSDHTYRLVYPVGVGETELVISADSGVELRIPITVTDPVELTVGGAYWADLSDGEKWYAFTPEETGEYILYSDYEHTAAGALLYSIDENNRLIQMDYSNWGSDFGKDIFQLRNELEAGITYYYKIDYWMSFAEEPGTQFYLIEPCELTDITVNTDSISGHVGTEAVALEIITTPQYADMSAVTVESTDPEIVTVSYKNGTWYYTLVGEGTAQIVVTYAGQVYTIDVDAKLIPALELDVPAHTVSENYEDVRMFTFTPETDGNYTFYVDVTEGDTVMYLTNSVGSELGQGRGGERTAYEDIHVYLEAGHTYTLTVYCNYMYSVADYSVTVTSSRPLESITCDESEIRMTWVAGETPTIHFINIDLYPAHAAANSLTYTVLDTSVAEVAVDFSGYYCIYPTGIGETELVISADNGVELRIPIIVTSPDSNVLYGDVNQDGSVDNMDATLILQYAANWDIELKDTVAADVNCDGSIDNMDATLILQFAANWDVTLGPSN